MHILTVLFVVICFWGTRINSQVLYPILEEPLTDGKTAAKQEGGSFSSQGWKSSSNSDKLRYILPDSSYAGKIEFDVKGYNSSSGDRHVWSVCNVYASNYKPKEPCNMHDCIHLRLNNSHKGSQEMWRAHGVYINGAYTPGGSVPTSCNFYVGRRPQSDADISFDSAQWYRMTFTWNQIGASYYVNGVARGILRWPFVYAPRKVINLGHDPYYSYSGLSNVLYKNVKISIDLKPGDTKVTKHPGISYDVTRLAVTPNPFNKSTMLSLKSVCNPGEKVTITLFNINGKLVDRISTQGQTLIQGIHYAPKNITAGIYILKAEIKKRSFKAKLLIQ
jgi:hypothetical protein